MSDAKITPYRPNDYLYDPIFTVSGEKDFYKEQFKAKMSRADFAVCPIFSSMFSDMSRYPRQQYVIRQPSLPPIFKRITRVRRTLDFEFPSTTPEIEGRDWCKFFQRPRTPSVPQLALDNLVPPGTPARSPPALKLKQTKNKKIQTKWRESSAQTSPWQPDYRLMEECDPEILKLDFLKWGSGLPAGVHEVILIQRARMKRKWEEAMPPVVDEASLILRKKIIEALEMNEWAFREQEIQDIQDLRLELLEQMLNELHDRSKQRSEKRMKMFCDQKMAEKEEKIHKLRHKTERELRKLRLRKEGVDRRYHPVNVIQEHADRKSELYGPQMRHGEDPKRRHFVLNNKMRTYHPRFVGVEFFEMLPDWLHEVTRRKGDFSPKLAGTRLCVRETKWTTPILKKLYEELKDLRRETKQVCSLRQRVEKKPESPRTPNPEGIDDKEETMFQACVLLQSVLRGRASQILIYSGRDTCRELIRELRTTHGLRIEDKKRIHEARLEVMSQQRDRNRCQRRIDSVQEDLARLSGSVVGSLLSYLNKSLQRLVDERRAHAICLLAERERARREAAEAGRRQKELRRMEEHDEMFKQIVKMHQETVDLYLQDIIIEGMEFTLEEDAKRYITRLAEQVDEEAYQSLQNPNVREEEDLIADIFHHFVLPDVEKQILRDNLRKKQRHRLKAVHDEIYKTVETLPIPVSESETEIESYPSEVMSEGMLAEIMKYLKAQEGAPSAIEEEMQGRDSEEPEDVGELVPRLRPRIDLDDLYKDEGHRDTVATAEAAPTDEAPAEGAAPKDEKVEEGAAPKDAKAAETTAPKDEKVVEVTAPKDAKAEESAAPKDEKVAETATPKDEKTEESADPKEAAPAESEQQKHETAA